MASGPPIVTVDWGTEDIREEALFTETMLLSYEFTKSLAGPFTQLVAAADAVLAQTRTLEDNITRGLSQVVVADRALDSLVDEVDEVTRKATGQNRQDEQYKLLFPKPPHQIKRPRLGAELVLLDPWPSHLEASKFAELKALAPIAAKRIEDGRAAVRSISEFENKLEQLHTTGAKADLVTKVNAERAKAFGLLSEMAHSRPDLRLPADFAAGFFPRAERRAQKTVTVEDLDQRISELQKSVAALQEQRNDLAAHAEVETRAREAAERKAAQHKLTVVRQQVEQLNREASELEKKLTG